MKQVSDLNVASTRPLPSPEQLCADVARTEAQADSVASSREKIQDILFGRDDRFLLIVGPCSIHDRRSCMEYAERLAKLADEVKDHVCVVMRVYFEKPRTTVGWKGLIMDPHLDGTYDIPTGLNVARGILRDIVDLGLPTATELLDPITPQYITDLICWTAIGARTTESQTHRQMASGLSMPLGFKNGTNGAIQPAINAIKAATQRQTFLGVDREGVASAVTTRGNPDCHLILRGGDSAPNYDTDSVVKTIEQLDDAGVLSAVMVDASHANCLKDHGRMPAVYRSIVQTRKDGHKKLFGAMLESNLVAGNQSFPQPLDKLVYGQSITDACIDWDTTVQLVRETAEALA